MTKDEIAAFQTAHYDWEGKALKRDGDPGPRTRWALAVAALDPRRQGIVARACGSVGIAERGTNRGPEVDTWLERCGAPLGLPWCAAFASWCLSVPGMPLVRQAGAQKLGKSFLWVATPEPGDVMWFPTGPSTGHCGIVVGIGDREVAVVEGNSGNAVRCVRRRTADVFFGAPLEHVGAADVPLPIGLTLVPVQREGTR